MLALAPAETWLSLPNSCLYWALICPCPTTQLGSECERWPGCYSDPAVGLLLPNLAGSREIQRGADWHLHWWWDFLQERAWRWPWAIQRRSWVPDPCIYLCVVGSLLGWWEGTNHPRASFVFLYFQQRPSDPKPGRSWVWCLAISPVHPQSFTQKLTLPNRFSPNKSPCPSLSPEGWWHLSAQHLELLCGHRPSGRITLLTVYVGNTNMV